MSFSGLLGGNTDVLKPSPEITAKLKEMLPEYPFHIKAEVAEHLAKELDISKAQLMVELIPIARQFAVSVTPVSHFQVGSCCMGLSGDLYLGMNIEFGGENLAQTVHSEQSSTTNLMCHGEKGMEALAVSSEPCGGCRQFLNEFACANDFLIMIPERKAVHLGNLLPRSFGPHDLGIKAGMLEMVEEPLLLPKGSDALTEAAWRAANQTYAPYSHCNAGVALEFADGQQASGWYAENAAFNPSLSPLQAALIMALASGHNYKQIVRAVLVERDNNIITHAPATKSLLGAIAPQAKLEIKKLTLV